MKKKFRKSLRRLATTWSWLIWAVIEAWRDAGGYLTPISSPPPARPPAPSVPRPSLTCLTPACLPQPASYFHPHLIPACFMCFPSPAPSVKLSF
ncbi:hypothetical protein E2C01_102047 [Portunus trituberculatus]|uniref:Secreted protein n=1 Tax=Portunus trituberculatus TaxID=210409 RepID=A0A5B7KHI8_PORTR|nr:hypothetical protein [Portunus trituberculatus]